MLRIDLLNARPGMTLALPIYHPEAPDRVLLRANYELVGSTIERLRAMGLRCVWVRYPSVAFIEKYIDQQLLAAHAQVVKHITDTFATSQAQSGARLRYDEYTRSIGVLLQRLLGNPDAAVFMEDICNAPAGGPNGELMRHSSAVTYLALLMGLKLEGYLIKQRRHIEPARAKDVSNLGVGAMLHDVGVLQLDDATRDRFHRTGDETDPDWRQHPKLGFEQVRGHVDPSAATVVLNHHQRFDGKGYAGEGVPLLCNTSIHIFARIVALAERFDRMRHPTNLPEQPAVCVLADLLASSLGEQFDPTVLHALVCVAPPYPPGSTLRLSDGRWAVALDHNPAAPCRPKVQLIPAPADLASAADDDKPGEVIDLTEADDDLYVAEYEGKPVGDLNFTARDFTAESALAAGW